MGKIPETMKALVAYGKGNYKLELNYPTPECGPDDIIIKTEGCGVCAGDLKCYHGAAMFWGDDVQPSWVEPPFVPGHEFLGRVVEVGENVKEFKIGDRITADQIVPCGECKFCKTGRYWMCQPHATFGFQKGNNGGMAEYVKYPKTSVISRVPEDMPLEKALLIEPYGCSKHAVDRAKITNEDVVVISGAGTLGLGMITYARMKNPAKLIVLDMQDNRLEKAKEFGADIVMNPGKENVVAKVQELTDGYGCDIYIEATGHPSSVQQGLDMVRKLGTFVEFSVFGAPAVIDWSIIGDRKELDVLGSHLSPYCYPFVIENIANGNLKTEGVVSKVFPIEDWEEAFEYIASTNTYVVGLTGSEKLMFLNEDFVQKDYTSTSYAVASTIGGTTVRPNGSLAEGMLPQSINSDGTHIYATWVKEHKDWNYIVVYDMSGNKVTEIKTNLNSDDYEVESLIVGDNSLYLVTGIPGKSTTYLYEITAANLK